MYTTIYHTVSVFIACCAVGVAGCGHQQYSGELPVYRISGTVTVDGSPVENIQIALHPVGELQDGKTYYPQGFTDGDGKVKISTYSDGDGAPAGDYRLTFILKQYNAISRSFTGNNQLHDQYSDPKKSPIELTIGADLDNDLGQIDLKSH